MTGTYWALSVGFIVVLVINHWLVWQHPYFDKWRKNGRR